MTKKRSFEEPTLFSSENGELFVPVPGASMSQEADTSATSCAYVVAAIGFRFRCPLSKCPDYLQKCF